MAVSWAQDELFEIHGSVRSRRQPALAEAAYRLDRHGMPGGSGNARRLRRRTGIDRRVIMGHRRPVAAQRLARPAGDADHFVMAMVRAGNLLRGEHVKHAEMALSVADQHDISRYRGCCCLHVLGFRTFFDNCAAHMARRSVQNAIRKSGPPSNPSQKTGLALTGPALGKYRCRSTCTSNRRESGLMGNSA